VAINSLEAWDIAVRDGLDPMRRPWLTRAMEFVSALGSNEVLGVVTVLATIFFIFIGRWRTGLCLVAAGLLAYGIEHAAKPFVNRPRPDVKWVEPSAKKTPSFPSGHALLAMTVYATIALSLAVEMENRKTQVLVVAGGFLLPLLIGFSRMYLGLHYLSDVVGGFLAALGCVFLFRWIDLKWSAVSKPQLAPPAPSPLLTPAPAPPKAREQIQRASGEQIQP
jgi:undecaprenyl-diphosphatase